MRQLLFTKEDIQRYRPTARNISGDRIEPYMHEAQEIDFQQIVGPALYVDLLEKLGNPLDALYTDYTKLIQGTRYIPAGETNYIDFPGALPMLSYFALARFIQNNPINIVSYGVVQKVSEESTPVSQAAIKASVDELRALGIAYQSKVIKYLREKSDVFLLYTYSNTDQNSSGVKFFDV
jgi:hypothetical protein